MRQSLLTSLLTSLALTLIIELAAAWVMRIRSVLDLTFVALANCITNPIVNVCFYFALSVFSARSPLPYVMLAGLEIAAVFAEFLYYKITLRYLEISKLKLSVVLNTASFMTGRLISFLKVFYCFCLLLKIVLNNILLFP